MGWGSGLRDLRPKGGVPANQSSFYRGPFQPEFLLHTVLGDVHDEGKLPCWVRLSRSRTRVQKKLGGLGPEHGLGFGLDGTLYPKS